MVDPSMAIALTSNRWIAAILPLAAACVQSKHGDGPGAAAVPGGEVRVLEERPGRGRPVVPGDRIRVELTGQYARGGVWGQGPLTLIAGNGTYPGTTHPLRVGSLLRMQYVVNPNDTSVRLMTFQGGDSENEAYQVRRDRGQIVIEHKVVAVCRPMKLFLLQTGYGTFEFDLGCWKIPRMPPPRVDPRRARLERMIREIDTGEQSVEANGVIVEPPVVRRPAADTMRFLGDSGLHLAAREGRPDMVGWLLARGREATSVDAHGFEPIHYVGYAQRPFERFVPAFEQSYVDVVDTLLAHGATVDARVRQGTPQAPTLPEGEHEGATALAFAGADCADRLVARLLARGADPNAHGLRSVPPIIGAAINGCPETIRMLLARGARIDAQPEFGGTALERLISVSAFHDGHFESARLLVLAGAKTAVARERLEDRLDDPGPGGFGFSNRPVARRILKLLRASKS
jgi:ankyrin repeat protein